MATLTIREAAVRLGLSLSGVSYRIRKGHLNARVIKTYTGSRLCIITEEDFADFKKKLGARLPNGRYGSRSGYQDERREENIIVDPEKVKESLETRKLNNDWFFWTHNKHCHFIIFRVPEDRVATGRIREIAFASGSCKHEFQWEVTGPCWSTYEEKGVADTLLLAKQAVNARVMKVIAEEFKEE